MPDEERIEQLELEVKILRDNNKGLKDTLKQTQNSWYEDTKVIEKQQKEIEELKEGFKIQEHNYQVAMEEIEQRWEDKIKAKIEELENEKEKYFEKQVIQHEIEVLKSLIEKE